MAAASLNWPERSPEVIVMDISISGIDAMRILQQVHCSSRVLFLTRYADLPLVEEALRAGASGLVLKVCEPAELVKAIQFVVKDTTYVTPIVARDLLHLYRSGCNATSGAHSSMRNELPTRVWESLNLPEREQWDRGYVNLSMRTKL